MDRMIKDYIIRQQELHPSMQPQDVVKLCYQAVYGAEHLLMDVEAAREYFDSEYAAVLPKDGLLYEEISEKYCRLNLASWKHKGWPKQWLFRMFAASVATAAQQKSQTRSSSSESEFEEYLKAVRCELSQHCRWFSEDGWNQYLERYKMHGMGPVHHSPEYREKEQPAYRVVDQSFVELLPILEAVVAWMSEQKKCSCNGCIIAIDGRAAAGKSTLAHKLKYILEGEMIRMDDFFLPPVLRTGERFVTPGGNIHYERFQEEVLPFLSSMEDFTYRRFDCSIMDYQGEVQVKGASCRIVEGSYSLHPIFGDYADITVFCDVDPKVQMERIKKRNGIQMAEMFRTRWIPLEEAYFQSSAIRDKAMILKKS